MKYLEESPASDLAQKLGLSYLGFGRYGRSRAVTHVSKFGRLQHITKVDPLETLKGGQLKHLHHQEDEVFTNGIAGVRNVLDQLNALKHGDSSSVLSTKFDGAPSIVLGTHPETEKFFVATKSAFNKDPKINYTAADIKKNHGHAPGLALKLKELLSHGPKLDIKGVVQGDLLFGEHDKEHDGGNVSFKPNTIRYSIPTNHAEGQKVSKAKIGLAIHTRYDKDGQAILDPNIKVKEHPDVYNAKVSVDPKHMKFDTDLISKHQSEIGKLMNIIPKEGWEAIKEPALVGFVNTYINSKVRADEADYKVAELIGHVQSKFQKELSAAKTENGKVGRVVARDNLIKHIRNNATYLKTAFEIQKHIVSVKHHIIDSLNKGQEFKHTYEDGELANPEGYVVISHHGPLKLVNRGEFSRQNFNAGKFQK
jgi:hypothetical protein